MTKFKVFELDGWFEFTVHTSNISKAVSVLRANFGQSVSFVIII